MASDFCQVRELNLGRKMLEAQGTNLENLRRWLKCGQEKLEKYRYIIEVATAYLYLFDSICANVVAAILGELTLKIQALQTVQSTCCATTNVHSVGHRHQPVTS